MSILFPLLILYCLNIFQQLLHVFKSYLNRTLKIITILLKIVPISEILVLQALQTPRSNSLGVPGFHGQSES